MKLLRSVIQGSIFAIKSSSNNFETKFVKDYDHLERNEPWPDRLQRTNNGILSFSILTTLISYMNQIYRGEDSLNQNCSASIVTYLAVEADCSS